MITVEFILLPHPLHRWVSGVEPQHRSWYWVRLRSPSLDFLEIGEVWLDCDKKFCSLLVRYGLWRLGQGI
jgi:hypothetical protein